jgi:aryl-alcohol dehydrogenase-like predicted oxidoreductase
MNFGPRTPAPEAEKMIHAALDAGVNVIDTADFYGQPLQGGHGQGETEKIVGPALSGRRDRVILATKFLFPTRRDDPNARGGSRRHVIQACEASLRRLQTDYIDLYQMHRPDPSTPIDETLRALDDLIRDGKVRYIGTSMFAAWQLTEALWVSDRLRLNRFISEQPRYNLLQRGIENELVPMAQRYGIGLLAYAPLQGGVLTGKYRRAETPPEDSRQTFPAWKRWAASFLNDRVFAVLEVLRSLAAQKNCTVSQLAVAWVLHQPGVSSAIIGPRTPGQLQDNLAAARISFTTEDFNLLDQAVRPGTNAVDR